LIRCAGTALNSKLIERQKEFFSEMLVTAVQNLAPDDPIDMVAMKQVSGGSVSDSILVQGVAFKKTFAYAGFEQQPKHFQNPAVLLLNIELELKSERQNAEIRIKDPSEYQELVNAEWSIIYEKLDLIVASGAKVVLSRLPIGDLATQYFADRNIFCAGRVPQEDMVRVSKATNGVIQTSVSDLQPSILGTCGEFNERQIGSERYNVLTGCPQARTATIILRGGSAQFIEESERSLHDALMIIRRATKHDSIVAGGGAIEMELSKHLRAYSRTIKTKIQLIVAAFAKALEVIPRQLCVNAGFDATEVVNQLRARHAKGEIWMGVDIENEGVCDTYNSFVWEPSLVKKNAISAACEAACLILSIDQTVRNVKSQSVSDDRPAQAGMSSM